MQKSLAISCLMHLLLILALWFTFFVQRDLKIGAEIPANIAVSFVSIPEKENIKAVPPTQSVAEPAPVRPLPKAVPSIKKPAVKIKPVLHSAIKAPHPKKIAAHKQIHSKVAHKPEIKLEKKVNKPTVKQIQEEDARLGHMFAKQISDCVHSKFNLVALGMSGEHLKIKAIFRLQKNGALEKLPDIQILGGDEHQKDIASSQAVSALKACSPFSLPVDKYYLWKDIEMVFDPYTQLN